MRRKGSRTEEKGILEEGRDEDEMIGKGREER